MAHTVDEVEFSSSISSSFSSSMNHRIHETSFCKHKQECTGRSYTSKERGYLKATNVTIIYSSSNIFIWLFILLPSKSFLSSAQISMGTSSCFWQANWLVFFVSYLFPYLVGSSLALVGGCSNGLAHRHVDVFRSEKLPSTWTRQLLCHFSNRISQYKLQNFQRFLLLSSKARLEIDIYGDGAEFLTSRDLLSSVFFSSESASMPFVSTAVTAVWMSKLIISVQTIDQISPTSAFLSAYRPCPARCTWGSSRSTSRSSLPLLAPISRFCDQELHMFVVMQKQENTCVRRNLIGSCCVE